MPSVSAYREYLPSARLARYVECYWSRGDEHDQGAHSVLPDGCADILFTSRRDEPEGLTVVGLMTTPLSVKDEQGRSHFGVRFRPGMAAAFLPEAASLNDRIEPLESLWGKTARELFAKLAESASPLQMTALVEEALRPLEPPDAARRVLWRLPNTELPLEKLVSDAGLSERHFRRECIERTGVSPKYLRRILRFRAAVQRIRALASRTSQPSWAQLAAACQYYDQAHFIRDFQEFAGCTPGRFLQSLRSAAGIESRDNEPAKARKSNRLH